MRNEAVLDFAIELYTFYNFFLDTDGVYQIRTSLQAFSKHYSQVFLGASKKRNGVYVSKCFPISATCDTLQTDINETARFEVHAFPRDDIRVHLQNSSYELRISLYATRMTDNGTTTTTAVPTTFELVTERVLNLSFDPATGLHHYLPVVFEVGNLSLLTVAIHASLLMVCIPDIENLNQSYLKQVVGQLCNCDIQSSCCYSGNPDKNVSQELISLLTRTANQLRRRLEDYKETIFGGTKYKKDDILSDMSSTRARERVSRFATCDREDSIQFIDEETRKMSVVLIVLWEQYLEIALGRVEVQQALYLPLQKKRLARMAEAYLILYKDRNSIYYDAQISEECYRRIAQQMRRSEYLRAFPVLEVECSEVDGCAQNIPIIFEERYTKPKKQSKEERSSSISQNDEVSDGENEDANKFSQSLSRGSMEFLALTSHPDTEVCNCRRQSRFVNLFPSRRTSKSSFSGSSSSRLYSESISQQALRQEKRFSKVKRDFFNTIALPVRWETPDLEKLYRWNFPQRPSSKNSAPEKLHLIIMVHGLFGSATDLRLLRLYLELANPYSNIRFLLSRSNEREGTFKDFDTLGKRLAVEIIDHIRKYNKKPSRISFIGFSMGNLIIRSALMKTELKPLLRNLHTFLSIGGPHLGVIYNPSRIITMGLWYLQRFENTDSLRQMAFKDKEDMRDTYLYRLSLDKGLRRFRNILLVGSADDCIVPVHSAHVKLTKAALKDDSPQGAAYREMSRNILKPLLEKRGINLIRYEIHVPFKASILTTNIHIAPLDREVLVQKLVMVACAKHFT